MTTLLKLFVFRFIIIIDEDIHKWVYVLNTKHLVWTSMNRNVEVGIRHQLHL